ncbi:serine protease svh-1-like isoform X3 [Octopus vulgaris]|uniref:Serine protease svh-1-like isoform X3 n=1 Tax=Octopus vulgaris TaxID=6645 RepID=A0AA36AWB9_OCTVU|nr:serine protease svh-1-like isoform X3 [Octopus vulgaris]
MFTGNRMKLPIFILVILVFALWLDEIEAKKQCSHLKGREKAKCMKENRSPNNKRCGGLRGRERAQCNKRGPTPNTTPTPEPVTEENNVTFARAAFYEPLGHSNIRLVGNTSFYNAGLISIYRNNSWGYVCDDNWDMKDADVACKQLGFSRGAEVATGNSRYGLAESEDFLMDNTDCKGDESALQYCSYDTEHDCKKDEAAGVICKPNPGCKPGWISGPSGCYRLFIGNARRLNAKEMCYTKDSHLVIIDSLEENAFLSVLLQTNNDNHVWLTDGFRYGSNWAWRYEREAISTFYWFPGWMPDKKSAEPSKRGRCISLSNMFQHDRELYMTSYFFWKTSNCNSVTGFICERKKTPDFTEECYSGNGVSYRGSVSETVRGTPCLKWTENLKYNTINSPNAGLGNHNHCRNPDKDKRPWCWVAPAFKNQFGYCKIDHCKNVTESTTVESTVTTYSTTVESTVTTYSTTVAPTTTTTKPKPTCSPVQMRCKGTNVCIPLTWRCDGERDCRKGDDEENCRNNTCNNDKMLCSASQTCIPISWKCDGEADCTDSEDEKNCEPEVSCAPNSMMCPSRKICIPLQWKCDGDRDCPEGEDESDCGTTTNSSFTCPPGKMKCLHGCLPESWRCDGSPDCPDSSDEINCTAVTTTKATVTTTQVPLTTTHSLNCPLDKMYCSASKTCISLNWKCDGENDCSDGEDEKDCDYTLDNFEKQDTNFIIDSFPKEVYVRIPLETCARTCLYHREFVCKAFHYRENGKQCKLFDTTKSFSIRPLSSGSYYVLSQNCTSTDFQCDNGRCIPGEEKCNGRDDCNDFSDEQDCGVPETLEIRLADGEEHSGRVEIKYLNEWGVVCDDKWDIKDANVVCRMLGYTGAVKAIPFSNFGPGNANFLLTNVECIGNETSLLDCPKSPWRQHNCKRHETASVICKLDKGCPPNQFECAKSQCLEIDRICDTVDNCGDNSDEKYCTASVKLVNGTNPSNGRIQITINNITGTICDDNFDNIDAIVVCRQLGYKSGIALPGGTYGKGNGIIWYDEINCFGDEDSIEFCEGNPKGEHDCDHTEDVGIQCYRDTITTTTLPTTTNVASTTTVDNLKCGRRPIKQRSQRITGGVRAIEGAYPWQARIFRSWFWGRLHHCGASVIGEFWVITAAHCVMGKKKEGLIVKVGDHSNKVWDKYEQTFKVAELVTHPRYDDNSYDYDIALIKIEPNRKGKWNCFQ